MASARESGPGVVTTRAALTVSSIPHGRPYSHAQRTTAPCQRRAAAARPVLRPAARPGLGRHRRGARRDGPAPRRLTVPAAAPFPCAAARTPPEDRMSTAGLIDWIRGLIAPLFAGGTRII